MSFKVNSTPDLASEVRRNPQAPAAAPVGTVFELSGKRIVSCGRKDLLSWMGWLTAGPPSLTAEALRTAGAWALIRYSWALGYNSNGSLAPTALAQDIRHHNRVSFSEAVGVGVAGRLACHEVAAGWPVFVANLDDVFERLVDERVVRPLTGRSKYPDYLLTSRGRHGWQLLVVECKGTVGGLATCIEQLARGTKQVLALESPLPLRRLVFGTTMELDSKDKREVKAYAVETMASEGGGGTVESLPKAVLDAVLIRALRCAGEHDLARLVQSEGLPEEGLPIEVEENLAPILGQRMVGVAAAWGPPTARVEAAVGVNIEMLRALASSPDGREERIQMALEGVDRRGTGKRSTESDLEFVMPDGIGIRLAWSGGIFEPPREEQE